MKNERKSSNMPFHQIVPTPSTALDFSQPIFTENQLLLIPKCVKLSIILNLFMTLMAFETLKFKTVPPGLLLNHSDWAKCLEGRQVGSQSRNICLGRPMLPRVLLPRCSNSMQNMICNFKMGIQNQSFGELIYAWKVGLSGETWIFFQV